MHYLYLHPGEAENKGEPTQATAVPAGLSAQPTRMAANNQPPASVYVYPPRMLSPEERDILYNSGGTSNMLKGLYKRLDRIEMLLKRIEADLYKRS